MVFTNTHDLPAVAFDAVPVRRRIVAWYWLVVLLAVPLWWVTTSIERLALPAVKVDAPLRFPVRVLVEDAKLAARVDALLDREGRDWDGMDVVVMHPRHGPLDPKPTYRVELHRGVDPVPSLWLDHRTLHVRAAPPQSDTGTNTLIDPQDELAHTIAATLSELLAPRVAGRARIAARYARTYRLAFSLLNEEGTALRWDIRGGIQRSLASTLAQLGALHNFTVESQVQFHAPLAFVPRQEDGAYVLHEDELKMFVNSAEWTLASSVSQDPVLHFILFVPSPERRPLRVHDAPESNSFIVPQWGGVVILNPPQDNDNAYTLSASDLAPTMHTFRSQLLSLLGTPALPAAVSAPARGLSTWQLDTLQRRRARENAHDSTAALQSIAQLVTQIDGMPVGQDVRGDVQGTLDALRDARGAAGAGEALGHTARAQELASRAFFNPGMLALLYFPAEHKYAVYIPLFAPVGVPLVAALLREVKRWRRERGKEKEGEKKKVE